MHIINSHLDLQTLIAINHVTTEILVKNPDFRPIKPMDYGKFLVISLGTGSPKQENKYNARNAAKWGVLGWLFNNGDTPMVDIFTQASADMVDIHTSIFFQADHCENNYLRIQVKRIDLKHFGLRTLHSLWWNRHMLC